MPFLQHVGFSATHAFQRKWLPVGMTVGWMTSPSQPPTPLACTSRILPPIWRLNHLYQNQLGTCLTDPCYWGQHRHHAFWFAKCLSHLSVVYWWCMSWSRLGYMYILVACSSPAQNLQHLQARFQCLSDHRLVINPTKCDFGKSKLNFLSYTINTSGISLTLSMLRQFAPSWQFLRTWRHCTSLLASLLHCTTTDLPWCAEVLQPLQQALAADSFTSC